MPMYRGGNEMLSAFSNNTEICFGYVNGVRVFNCDQGPIAYIPMIMTVDANGGGGVNYMFELVLDPGFAYNFVVNWGDGTEDIITSPVDPALDHQYPSMAMHYTVTVTGLCQSLGFGGIINHELLLDVTQWGYTGATSTLRQYGNGAFNCVFSATDDGGMQDCVNMGFMFDFLDANPFVENFEVGLCSNFSSFMRGCINANPNTTSWDMRNALTIDSMFQECPSYTGVGVSFWDTEKLQSANNVFRDSPQFDQDISGWNISELTAAQNILNGSGFSDINYDLLLIAWAAQAPNIQPTVIFHAGSAKYTTGGAAEAGRDLLAGTYNWEITDGGPVP